jgi:hypothetical protein
MDNGKSTPKLAIMVAANNVDPKIVKRFLWGVSNSEKKFPFDVILGNHREPTQKFYKTVILNDIIRTFIRKYDVLVQTDIDMLIPPLLICNTYHFCMRRETCYHCNYHLLDLKEIDGLKYGKIPWVSIRKRKSMTASGSWNGLRNYMWNEMGGFCEAIALLGGPDSEFYMRSVKNNYIWYTTSNYPLCHINHPRRPITKQGKKNLSVARQFPITYNWLKNRNRNVCKTKFKVFSFGV